MKNRTVFASIFLSVLISALLFSVTTVFGATPTQTPPLGNIGPTFSGVTAGGLIINGGSSFNGNVQISGTGSLTVGGISSLTGNVSVGGDVGLASGKTLTVDNIKINTDRSSLEITSPVHFTQPIILDYDTPLKNDVSIYNLDVVTKLFSSGIAGGGKLLIDDGVKVNEDAIIDGNLSINGSLFDTMDPTLTVKDSLSVAGSITATSGIGRFYVLSNSVSVPASSYGTINKSCNSGDSVVSCGFSSTTIDISANSLVPTGTNCILSGYNKGTSAKNMYVYTTCFSSD